MSTIGERVRRIREEIAEAEIRAGAAAGSVRLLAATKTVSAEAVREAVLAGVDLTGENRVSELVEKNKAGAYEGVPKHMIGRLQTNKVNKVVGLADCIQSVDRPELLHLISRRAALLEAVQPILLEVNIGREESKGGYLPEAVEEAAAEAASLPGLRLEGLMAIPPVPAIGTDARPGGKKYPYFEEMYNLYIDISAKKYDNTHIWCLSMGMSADFTQAIVSGSNLVRVGTGIFGARGSAAR